MQAHIDIEFNQLVEIAKQLPAKQWKKLKEKVEETGKTNFTSREEYRKLLLEGPTYSKSQLETIAKTRKAIDQWRLK